MADQDQGAGAIPQRPLGRTGAKVSALGLGGHHLGDLKTVDEAAGCTACRRTRRRRCSPLSIPGEVPCPN